MLEGIENIFQNKSQMLKKLKKKLFEDNTKVFIENYGHFFEEMSGCMKQAEEKHEAAKEISACFVKSVKETHVNKRGKVVPSIQMDLNLFMIYYVFPTILNKVEEGKLLADTLCKVWNREFGTEIQYTDYETLHGAFKEKIFGIF